MPEGDTIYRTAVTLRRALQGKRLTRFETRVEAVAEMDRRMVAAGRTVHAVEPRGKHLLIVLRRDAGDPGSDPGETGAAPVSNRLDLDLQRSDLVLHTHLRMTGSWHLYRTGEAWRKPAWQARVALYTEEFEAPCFSAPVVELLSAREAARHPDLVSLGPDAMTPGFDAGEALQRIRQRAHLEISVALMDQHAMAGVGNVYKSEVLFLRRISPFVKVGALSEEDLEGLIAESHRLLELNKERGSRRTRFALDQRARLWVYGREGQPCRVCGTTIRMRRQGVDARMTYYCPRCQGVEGAALPD